MSKKQARKKSNSGIGCLALLIAGGALWFTIQNNQNKSAPVPRAQSKPTATPQNQIRRADYGEAWPFTVNEGILSCSGGLVTLWSDGWTYAINGLARGAMAREGWRDVYEIWRDAPAGSASPKVDLGWVITLGMSLCPGGQQSEVVTNTPAPVSTHPPATQPPVQQAPIQQAPSNCQTAVALGLSASEAARYPNLDRDHDGVACYGD